jgi:hypothetical protein
MENETSMATEEAKMRAIASAEEILSHFEWACEIHGHAASYLTRR